MNIYERAAAAWKVQSEKERAARTELEQRQRNQFESLLKEVTGTDVFSVQGAGEDMTTEVEGVRLIPIVNFHSRKQNIMALRIAYQGVGEKDNFSNEIFTSGDLG